METETTASLFNPYRAASDDGTPKRYGGIYPSGSSEPAWQSANVEQAVRADRVDMLQECVDRGWINPQSRCFDNSLIVDYCDYRNAAKCAARLRELGWPEHKAAEMPDADAEHAA